MQNRIQCRNSIAGFLVRDDRLWRGWGDIWQCLEIVLILTTGQQLAKKDLQPKILRMLRLRSPGHTFFLSHIHMALIDIDMDIDGAHAKVQASQRVNASHTGKRDFCRETLTGKAGGEVNCVLETLQGPGLVRMSGFGASLPTFQSICQEHSPVLPQPSDPSVSLGYWGQKCCYLFGELGTIAE